MNFDEELCLNGKRYDSQTTLQLIYERPFILESKLDHLTALYDVNGPSVSAGMIICCDIAEAPGSV